MRALVVAFDPRGHEASVVFGEEIGEVPDETRNALEEEGGVGSRCNLIVVQEGYANWSISSEIILTYSNNNCKWSIT